MSEPLAEPAVAPRAATVSRRGHALRDEFWKRGYVVVRQLVDAAGAREALREVLARPGANLRQSRVFGPSGLAGTLRFSGLADCHGLFGGWCSGGPLERVAASLLGEARLFRDVWISKPAGAGGTFSPHQDAAYWDVEPSRLVSAWVSIGASDADNGGLAVVPASHRSAILHDVRLAGQPLPKVLSWALRSLVSLTGTGDAPSSSAERGFARSKEAVLELCSRACPALQDLSQLEIAPEALRGGAPVELSCEAGDVVFFHGRTVHSSGPNRGGRARDAYIASFRHPEAALGNKPEGFVPSWPFSRALARPG